mmetsp:Transcript_93389/g.259599  ORF Transcript_93389/g.259599 Transcript_93389/m.259599 type:complete len:221 (-) Transcript_93389:9-671(-)
MGRRVAPCTAPRRTKGALFLRPAPSSDILGEGADPQPSTSMHPGALIRPVPVGVVEVNPILPAIPVHQSGAKAIGDNLPSAHWAPAGACDQRRICSRCGLLPTRQVNPTMLMVRVVDPSPPLVPVVRKKRRAPAPLEHGRPPLQLPDAPFASHPGEPPRRDRPGRGHHGARSRPRKHLVVCHSAPEEADQDIAGPRTLCERAGLDAGLQPATALQENNAA